MLNNKMNPLLSGGLRNEQFFARNLLIFHDGVFGMKLKSAPPPKPRRAVPVKALRASCIKTTGQ